MYLGLALLAYAGSAFLYWLDLLPGFLLILLTVIALWQPWGLLSLGPEQRTRVTPLTGRLYLLFGVSYLATLWMELP